MGDLLFELTNWLRSTPLLEFSLGITDWPLNHLLVENFWGIPLTQFVHILALGGSFGAILMLSMRVYGFAGTEISMKIMVERYVPWVWWSLVVLLISGILMTIGEPVREFINPIFWIKMCMLVVTMGVCRWFFGGVLKKAAATNEIPGSARFGAALVIVIWCFLMLCGRWIAYAPV